MIKNKHKSIAVVVENTAWMLSVFNDQEKPSLIDITHPLTENGKWELDFCLSPYISELTTELSEKKKKRQHLLY